jgi:hypothetical protein
MGRVRLNLRSMSITDKIAKGRQIVSAITDNATFSTPHPPLTEVTTAVDDLEKASANHHRHKQVGQKCCRTGTQNEMIPAKLLLCSLAHLPLARVKRTQHRTRKHNNSVLLWEVPRCWCHFMGPYITTLNKGHSSRQPSSRKV